jgi:hypothetical protein
MLMTYAGEAGTTILTMNEQNLEWTDKVSGTDRIKLLALSEQCPWHWVVLVHISYFYLFIVIRSKTQHKSHKELKTLYIN